MNDKWKFLRVQIFIYTYPLNRCEFGLGIQKEVVALDLRYIFSNYINTKKPHLQGQIHENDEKFFIFLTLFYHFSSISSEPLRIWPYNWYKILAKTWINIFLGKAKVIWTLLDTVFGTCELRIYVYRRCAPDVHAIYALVIKIRLSLFSLFCSFICCCSAAMVFYFAHLCDIKLCFA